MFLIHEFARKDSNIGEFAYIFGMLRASLKKSGKILDDFDLIIPACAMTNNLTLVTNNTKYFSRIDDLKLTNWTSYPPKLGA